MERCFAESRAIFPMVESSLDGLERDAPEERSGVVKRLTEASSGVHSHRGTRRMQMIQAPGNYSLHRHTQSSNIPHNPAPSAEYRGVRLVEASQKYLAQIEHSDGATSFLGLFQSAYDAAKRHDAVAGPMGLPVNFRRDANAWSAHELQQPLAQREHFQSFKPTLGRSNSFSHVDPASARAAALAVLDIHAPGDEREVVHRYPLLSNLNANVDGNCPGIGASPQDARCAAIIESIDGDRSRRYERESTEFGPLFGVAFALREKSRSATFNEASFGFKAPSTSIVQAIKSNRVVPESHVAGEGDAGNGSVDAEIFDTGRMRSGSRQFRSLLNENFGSQASPGSSLEHMACAKGRFDTPLVKTAHRKNGDANSHAKGSTTTACIFAAAEAAAGHSHAAAVKGQYRVFTSKYKVRDLVSPSVRACGVFS